MSETSDEKTNEEIAWEAVPTTVVLAIEQQAKRFYAEERLDRARELSEKLVKMRPESSQHWALCGVIYRRHGRLLRALKCLQKAVELDSSNKNALVNLGESLILVGKVVEGADILRVVFENGYDADKTPAEHDVFTKRAGAQLQILNRVAEAAQAGELDEVRS